MKSETVKKMKKTENVELYNLKQEILEELERCIKCGLCKSQCPVFLTFRGPHFAIDRFRLKLPATQAPSSAAWMKGKRVLLISKDNVFLFRPEAHWLASPAITRLRPRVTPALKMAGNGLARF